MKRQHILGLAGIALTLMGSAPTLWAQATITQIRSSGPTSKFINLVYLSEGYTAAQLPQFLTDTTNVVKSLLSTKPWNSYSNYFNVFAISVASAQSGADHYTPTTNLVNTYFNSTFDSYGTQRLLTIPPNDRDGTYSNGTGKVVALLQQLMPEYDLAGLIVNDTTYGGSGGQFLLTSVNSASTEIANHEIGHTFAHLGDEYSTAFPGYPDVEEPNTTTNNTRALIKWNAWINAATPVPTPDVASNSTVVGLFEGAHYHTTGWYRPKHDCKMRTLGASYCEVCSQELVLSMYRLIRPIQSVSPATNSLVVSSEGSALFNLSVLKPTTTNLTVQWFTNGVLVPGATATNLVLNGAQLQTGTNQIKALVNDATTFVRTDPANNLWDTNVWTLSVVPAPAVNNLSLTTSGMGSFAFMLSTPTQVGLQYILEYKDAMLDPMWTPLETDPGTGGILNLTNLGITGPSRFFRIRVQ